jgi:hypothetical protein
MKQLVGRAWACGQPYGVYPFDQYFSDRALKLDQMWKPRTSRFPLATASRLDLPDRSIPDVRAERLAREEQEYQALELKNAA